MGSLVTNFPKKVALATILYWVTEVLCSGNKPQFAKAVMEEALML